LLNFVGNDPIEGFVNIAPWVIEDPVASEPTLTLDLNQAQIERDGLE